jgi:hypothetical protein
VNVGRVWNGAISEGGEWGVQRPEPAPLGSLAEYPLAERC